MNTIYVHEKNILKNLEYLQSLQENIDIFPVLKSNAYGHGLEKMCKIMKKTNVKFLVVDSFPEYQIVKKETNKNILLLGETINRNYKKFDFKRTSFCVYNIETIKYLSKLHKKITIHLFLNTGMNREGVDENQLLNILEYLKKFPKMKIEGVLSHFHSADVCGMDDLTQQQIDNFKKMYHTIVDYGYTPRYKHIYNSAGYLKIQDSFFNAARIGLSLYGYNPLSETDKCFKLGEKLKPALTIQTRVVSLQELKENEGISYGLIRKAKKEMMTATIPFGYAEGLPRKLSNNIKFGHKRTLYSQVGMVCMNLSTMLADSSFGIGDMVKILDLKGENTLVNRSNLSDQLIYEILVKLDKGIRREII